MSSSLDIVDDGCQLCGIIFALDFDHNFKKIELNGPLCINLQISGKSLLYSSLLFMLHHSINEIYIAAHEEDVEYIEKHIEGLKRKKRISKLKLDIVKLPKYAQSYCEGLRRINEQRRISNDFILMNANCYITADINFGINLFKERLKKNVNQLMTKVMIETPMLSKTKTVNDNILIGYDDETNELLFVHHLSPKNTSKLIDISKLIGRRNERGRIRLRQNIEDVDLYICSTKLFRTLEMYFDYMLMNEHLLKHLLTRDIESGGIFVYVPPSSSDTSAVIRNFNTYCDVFYKMMKSNKQISSNSVDDEVNTGYTNDSNNKNYMITKSFVGCSGSIGEGCVVENSYIGDNTIIKNNVNIRNSIILDNITIEDGVTIESAAVSSGCYIEEGASIYNNCIVGAEGRVSGSIKDRGSSIAVNSNIRTFPLMIPIHEDFYCNRKYRDCMDDYYNYDNDEDDESDEDDETFIDNSEGDDAAEILDDKKRFKYEVAQLIYEGLQTPKYMKNKIFEIQSLRLAYNKRVEKVSRLTAHYIMEYLSMECTEHSDDWKTFLESKAVTDLIEAFASEGKEKKIILLDGAIDFVTTKFLLRQPNAANTFSGWFDELYDQLDEIYGYHVTELERWVPTVSSKWHWQLGSIMAEVDRYTDRVGRERCEGLDYY